MTQLREPIVLRDAVAALDGAPHGLTNEQAHALLEAFPCCFLYNKGERREDGKIAPGKDPKGSGWQNRPRSPKEYTGRGLGVICGPVPGREGLQLHALDLDTPHAGAAQAMRQWLAAWIKDKGKQGEAWSVSARRLSSWCLSS